MWKHLCVLGGIVDPLDPFRQKWEDLNDVQILKDALERNLLPLGIILILNSLNHYVKKKELEM
jgi:hypothetical protein